MGLRVHEIILIGNGFYNSLHRKSNMRAHNFISHTRGETESHKHICWRVSAPLTNIASLQTCCDLTPEVHSNVGHDLSVKSLESQIKSWYFNLVIKVCHPLTLIQALSLVWNVAVQEWWTRDACVDHCAMPTEGTITWLWHFFFSHYVVTYRLKPSQYHVPGSDLDNWSEWASGLNTSAVLGGFFLPLLSNPCG